MAVRWIALTLQHHHASLLLDFDVVAREIPGCLEDLWFDELCNSLQDEICFLEAEFVGRVRDLISAKDMLYPNLLQSVLSMSSAFVLAYHLRCHAIFMLFHFKVCAEPTKAISVLINLNLFKSFLENRWAYFVEVPTNIMEAHDFVFLEEARGVRLRLLLNEVSKMAWLWIIDLSLWFNLSNCIKGVEGANDDAPLIVL